MSRGLKTGLAILVLLAVVALLPPPIDPISQVDAPSSRYRPPGTVLQVVQVEGSAQPLLADRIEREGGEVLIHRRDDVRRYPADEILNLEGDGVRERRRYVLGSDKFGRDVLSRMMMGTRVSLTIGLLAVALAFSVGILVGAVAATGGPHVDNLVMRFTDAFLSFPPMFLVLAIAALIQPSTGQVVILLGMTSWMTTSRLARGELLVLRERDFVLASRASGQKPALIVLRHMLPNALAPLVVDATLMVGGLILAEAALSFFGFGIQAPTPSWGNMIEDGRAAMTDSWWVAFFPGLAIVVTVVAFNLIGDGLRDHLDPQRHRIHSDLRLDRPA